LFFGLPTRRDDHPRSREIIRFGLLGLQQQLLMFARLSFTQSFESFDIGFGFDEQLAPTFQFDFEFPTRFVKRALIDGELQIVSSLVKHTIDSDSRDATRTSLVEPPDCLCTYFVTLSL
jgi:hypothetical protein